MSWISVEDRLPSEDDQVLGCSINGVVITFETLWVEDFGIWDITHWMPLPEPPNE